MLLFPNNALGTSGLWSNHKFDPSLDWGLTAYGTNISSSTYMYCDKFGWTPEVNSTVFTMIDAFISSGLAVDFFDVSVENANMTLNTLGTTQCSFDLDQFGGVAAEVTLSGFGVEPAEIIADGVLLENYTYIEASDSLIINSFASNIVISFPYGDDWAEIAVAIGFLAFIIGIIALALVVVKRRSED